MSYQPNITEILISTYFAYEQILPTLDTKNDTFFWLCLIKWKKKMSSCSSTQKCLYNKNHAIYFTQRIFTTVQIHYINRASIFRTRFVPISENHLHKNASRVGLYDWQTVSLWWYCPGCNRSLSWSWGPCDVDNALTETLKISGILILCIIFYVDVNWFVVCWFSKIRSLDGLSTRCFKKNVSLCSSRFYVLLCSDCSFSYCECFLSVLSSFMYCCVLISQSPFLLKASRSMAI